MRHAVPRLKEILPTMLPQHMSNVMWAFATLKNQPGSLCGRLGDEVATRISECQPQDVFLIAWSFATLRYTHEGCLQAIAGDLVTRAQRYRPTELVGLLYALAKSTSIRHRRRRRGEGEQRDESGSGSESGSGAHGGAGRTLNASTLRLCGECLATACPRLPPQEVREEKKESVERMIG